MSMMDNELFDTFGDEFKTLADRVGSLEKITDGDLIVMPDGTTYTMQDLGLQDVSVRVFYQSAQPTGLNTSTNVGDVWIDSDDGSQWFWDGLSWVSKASTDKYTGAVGLESFGPGLLSRLLSSIDMTSQGTAPSSPTYGDVWRDTSAGNAIKRWNGTSWITITDSNTTTAVNNALNDPTADVTDSAVRVFYQIAAPGSMNNTTHRGDLWFDTDDNYNKYKWDGTAWIDISGQEEDPTTDLLPPSTAPVLTVRSGIGSLFITWPGVPNADQLWYNLYMDDAAGVSTIGANLVGTFYGTVAVVQKMPDGTAIVPGTTYYFKAIAVDPDGAGPTSAEASGTPSTINLAQLQADIAADIADIDTIRTTADGKNTIYYQTSMPTGGTYKTNDEWFDIDDGYKPYRWNGTTWSAYEYGTSAIAASAITTAKLSAGAVTADKVAANSISADAIVVGGTNGSNFIMNGSFEVDVNADGKPDGWALDSGPGTWDRFSLSDAPDGQYVLRIVSTGGATRIVSKAFPVTPSEAYGFRFKARSTVTSASSYQIGINMSSTLPSGGYVTTALANIGSEDAWIDSLNTAWTSVSTELITLAGAKWASIWIEMTTASNTLYTDDVWFSGQADSVMIADGAIVAAKVGANEITGEHIQSETISTDQLAANSVTAGHLASVISTSSNFTTRALDSSGQPIGGGYEMKPTGFFGYNNSGQLEVTMPNQGVRKWVGDGEIQNLTSTSIEVDLSLNINEGATATLVAGIAAPSNPPTAVPTWTTVPFSSMPFTDFSIQSIFWDSATSQWRIYGHRTSNNDGWELTYSSTGTFVSSLLVLLYSDWQLLSGVRFGGELYFLYRTGTSTSDSYILARHSTGANYVYNRIHTSETPRLATDGTNLFVCEHDEANDRFAVRRVSLPPSGFSVLGTRYFSLTGLGTISQIAGVIRTAADFGSTKWVFTTRAQADTEGYPYAANRTYVYSEPLEGSTATHEDGFGWPIPYTNTQGLGWDGTNFYTTAVTSTGLTKYEAGNKWTDAGPIKTWYAAYAYHRDSDDAHTQRGKVVTFTMSKRAKLLVTAQVGPAGVNDLWYYVAQSNPGSSYGNMWYQGETANSPSSYSIMLTNVLFSGTADFTTNTFSGGGAPGRLVSSATDGVNPYIKLSADGSGRMGDLSWGTTGVLAMPKKAQAGTATVTTVANDWVSVGVTFPTAFASVPKVIATVITTGLPSISNEIQVIVYSKSTTGCTIGVRRGNAVSTDIDWYAFVA